MNTSQTFQVLLIEDNAEDAAVAQQELSREPQFMVTQVERLAEAVSELRNVHTDAVVLDLDLPDSDGVETLITLRQHAPHVPILVLASTPDDQCVVEAAREGAEGYLVKGDTAEGQLRRAVRFTVERKGSTSTDAPLAANSTVGSIAARAGEIAHKLNNLLTVMIGQTEFAMSKLQKELSPHDDLSEVLVAAERATQLTNELLHLRHN